MISTTRSRVVEHAVIDASPLIFFARSQHLELLHAFARTVWVPQSVADEIAVRSFDDPTTYALVHCEWLVTKLPTAIPPAITAWRLGAGESTTLAIAQLHGIEAIIDDLAARKCGNSLGISFRGTLGIVLVAKQLGLILSARQVINDFLRAGLYLSDRVLTQALARVGE